MNVQDGIRPGNFWQLYDHRFKFVLKIFQNLTKLQERIGLCKIKFFKKLISCVAHLLVRPEYLFETETRVSVFERLIGNYEM